MAKSRIEQAYGRMMLYVFKVANPFKKKVIRTQCAVHKYINVHALTILENDGFADAASFFSDYIEHINAGVVWADQDFKSSGHFYHPSLKRGLYGNQDAMSLACDYYKKALNYWNNHSVEEAMFYLGATAHLVQDMTIPQHANIRLLDSHRQYENFIKRTYIDTPQYCVKEGGYYLECIEDFIHCNARTAIRVYQRLKHIEDDDKRFYTTTRFILPLAQKTTAGCFAMFYRDGRRRLCDAQLSGA